MHLYGMQCVGVGVDKGVGMWLMTWWMQVRAVDALADSLPLLEEYLLLLKEVTEEAHVDLAAAFPQHRVLDVIRKLTDLQVSRAFLLTRACISAHYLSPALSEIVSLPKRWCAWVLRGWCLGADTWHASLAPTLLLWSA